ncbi:tRNA uridine(34) 5-carboxymethylaminomethyl modification radical SAM/GNAT enzyme Elp3 [Candidatus Woesearchaeota archaeon]|jgi:elongator complex protein 3|nr:tRNA uridine(34) 5-carboxymethylaminomethyl modification radical SAM/GNAT enzyme Elp3 [Candidatus Woesearchaeota archaeon]MBT5396870.1 tRNA uridine(34) 5-carboxymethylaminomethyl modification radical SAM/GNAT enzyme Elp3 [Candidatus Woesearchaeota archaeon]MBT5924866.1 tRNA uridine(34) 5-carboxymethylaminomethyl modification radical SAM/GNAT enzyme Elp3 [Candidatus Woesearchaeota archaeon]MBT6367610.1 tRNA uridine(34) 5-carboxymethylaminomethyl modification radical SAM/GNAT enzyme Elp3 [Candi
MALDFYTEIITELKQNTYSEKQWAKCKRDLALKHGLMTIPTNIDILLRVPMKHLGELTPKLITKPTRTLSGVSPVAIMTKPFPCPHGKCTMCPGGPESEFGTVPQSYTGREPATMRGIRNKYDAYLQVFNRLQQYILLGHNCEKVELILMGGTFPSFPLDYQEEFVTDAYKAMNDFADMFYINDELDFVKFKDFFELPCDNIGSPSRTEHLHSKIIELKGSDENETTLETEQLQNETAHIKCVALCIETRPDYGLREHGNQMLRLGCTRIELGIQSVYDDVLEKIQRGHTTEQTIKSIQVLKDVGFKVAGHYMPGLPGVNYEKDLDGMKQLFTDSGYKPDMIKLYPCMVTKGTKLYDDYVAGTFVPLDAERAAKLIAEFKPFIPEYCRVMRVQRDIPTYQIEAGVEMTNLRQYIIQKYNPLCRCIRCREPKHKIIDWDSTELKVIEYNASHGKEFFISVEDVKNDILIGFCRLRFPSENLRDEITSDSALVRELHVYGTATALGEEGMIQHKGWGTKLMEKAEHIALKHGKIKMVVISGIGAREYYKKKLNYKKEGPYMVKNIVDNTQINSVSE